MEEEQKVAAESVVETETTQDNSPQSEVEATTPQTEKVSEEAPVQTEEQRKAFQEMRLENKRLKEEIQARTQNESAFAAFKPKPVAPEVYNYVDPNTGETNWAAFQQAQQQAIRAQAVEAVKEELDEFTARNKHPQLFSDPEIEQEIADRWFASKMRGENISITSIADKYAQRYQKDLSKAEKVGSEKALKEVAEKEQASLIASNQSPSKVQRETLSRDREELVMKARYGSDDALAELMSKVSWANK